ncbi:MAG: polysaccharide deacetylase family protein [Variibacter sp.]|nr:polysaccharide deacetylase family protein [Variibacter sp.]
MFRFTAALSMSLWLVGPAATEPCPHNQNGLATGRVLAVDAASTPRVGRRHFPQTLALTRKEVVLTFDDGPWPGTTDRVLDALKRECVRATFFLLGRNAAAHPALARRILADGHSIGTHTYAHPLLSRMSPASAQAEIDRGIVAIETALQHKTAPFFRFPGFASTPALLEAAGKRGLVVFGADVWASDWNPMTPAAQLHLIVSRIEAVGGGIVLFHDTKAQTAAALPAFLRELNSRGFRVVHAVPRAPSAVSSLRKSSRRARIG